MINESAAAAVLSWKHKKFCMLWKIDFPVFSMSAWDRRKRAWNLPTFFDSGKDSTEVIVDKDHVSSLLGHIGTALAHGHANVSHLERWSVINCGGES